MIRNQRTEGLRACIGSKRFGIEAHEAPVEDFPTQPSQKDGLGRMCKTHWNQYTSALRKAALERKAVEVAPDAPAVEPEQAPSEVPAPKRSLPRRQPAPAIDGGGQSPD